MIPLSPEAESQLDALLHYYETHDRIEAALKLLTVLENVSDKLRRSLDIGLTAPRPYPSLAQKDLLWIKEGSYWIAYSVLANEPVIAGVYYDRADIPNRM